MVIEEARRKKTSKNDKRRFSDEQIRRLELMFESDSMLEPRKKFDFARELGLEPRQVAIWFQNKRARWKSKHIEKEYSSLLSTYNNLASQFESLKKQNQSLLLQLQELKKVSDGESECNNKSDFHQVKNDDSSLNAELWEEGENLELLRMVDTSDWGSLGSDDIISNQWWGFPSFID